MGKSKVLQLDHPPEDGDLFAALVVRIVVILSQNDLGVTRTARSRETEREKPNRVDG
jgi:hypothetical protein